MSKLYEVTRQLASSLDLDRVLDQIAARTVDRLGCDAAGIYMHDPERGGLVFRRGLHLPSRLTRDLVLRPGEGVAGRAYAERRAVWTRDRTSDPATSYAAGAAELVDAMAPRACLAVPIVIRGEVLGVCVAYFFLPQDFSPEQIDLLSALADHVGIAMDNAHHYEAMRAERVRLAQILDSTSDGIVLVSPAGEVEVANRRAGELLDFDAERAGGVSLAALVTGERGATPALGRMLAALGDGADGREGDVELAARGRVVHWSSRPTRDAAGAPIGVTLTLGDVTQERQVSQMKSDFVSFVTHQLRTPLSGIRWMLELAGEAEGLPDEAREYVGDASAAAHRLIGLVNDLLDLGRLETGALIPSPAPLDLGALTRSVLDEVRLLAQEKRHAVTLEGDADLPPVLADPQLLRQVVVNLVSNAIKYSRPEGRIAVRMEAEDGRARWSIADRGIGVPAAARERLFEKFYRAENATGIETEGTGLGLYLVRLIMERLGGEVAYEPTAGGGSTFRIAVPLASREAPVEADAWR